MDTLDAAVGKRDKGLSYNAHVSFQEEIGNPSIY
jgi:hypothetical protein